MSALLFVIGRNVPRRNNRRMELKRIAHYTPPPKRQRGRREGGTLTDTHRKYAHTHIHIRMHTHTQKHKHTHRDTEREICETGGSTQQTHTDRYTLSTYIYTYKHTDTHTHTYIYIYIYIYREREREREGERERI